MSESMFQRLVMEAERYVASCPRGCPEGECYCAEPSYGNPAYTGICPSCGGYEECYCGEE